MPTAPLSTLPPRPSVPLPPLAETIIAAVTTHLQAMRGGDVCAAEDARRLARAQFADMGVSDEYLRLFARVVLT